jgi:hypothetical protein
MSLIPGARRSSATNGVPVASPSTTAFSHDGRTPAASTPAGVRMWDVATGRSMGAQPAGMRLLGLSRTSRKYATGVGP